MPKKPINKKSTDSKRHLRIILALIVLALCIFTSFELLSNQDNNQNTETQSSYIRVIDGDTFEIVNNENSNSEIIRLICVDTPEKGKKGYEEATDFLSSLIPETITDIELEREGKDKYNRTLAWVYINSLLINQAIIDSELGVIFEYNTTNCSRLERNI